jgi:hypothetical protein
MQGMGNLVNGCVILICMLIFGQAGKHLDPTGSRNVIVVQFAVGAAVALFMAVWRFTRLKESKVSVWGAILARGLGSTRCTRTLAPAALSLTHTPGITAPVGFSIPGAGVL